MLGPLGWSLITLGALRWTAPAECPQADVLQTRLSTTVGASLADTADADVTVTRDAQGRYVARLRVHESPGDVGLRTLDEATCDVLADAVVTVLSLSLAPPPVAPVPSKARANEPPPPPVAPVATAAPSSRTDPRFAAGVLFRVDHGTLPSTAAGFGVEIAWYPLRTVRIEGSLLRFLGQSESVGDSAYGGSFRLTSGTLRGCWSPLGDRNERITLGPCVGVDVDHVDASGFGSTHVEDGDATWWAPSVGALARWQPLRYFAVGALADVAFAASRRSFVIVNGGSIYQPAVVAPRGQITAEVRF